MSQPISFVKNPTDGGDSTVDREHITTHGSDWLWAVFGVMLLSDLVILVWHFFIPRGQRVFHQVAVVRFILPDSDRIELMDGGVDLVDYRYDRVLLHGFELGLRVYRH